MTEQTNEKKIVGVECRFATYCPPPEEGMPDLHVVKEVINYSDGTTKPNVRLLKDYKRDFYVTKKGRRDHQDKKEWEDITALDRFETTQSKLLQAIPRALGTPWVKGDLRRLAQSPYLYGADILSTAVIKKQYQDRSPNTNTKYRAAPFDTETDVLHGTNKIIMATIACDNKVFTSVCKSFVAGQANVVERLQVLLKKYLGIFVDERKIEWEVELVDSEADVVVHCFNRAHEWKPDFVSIWNIDFDIQKVTAALLNAGLEPKDVLSDPSVPKEYRHFTYKQGSKQKVTASGQITPVKPSAQWHTVYCPSSFYFIDAMCTYRLNRTGSAEEPSYSLDSILDKEFKKRPEIRKLKFEEADGLTGIDWHQFMQEKYPLEYIIYNVFDCVSMQYLDEQTLDLSVTMPLFSGWSDFANYKSQPRRLVDNLHYFALQNGKVIGTTSNQMTTELDALSIGVHDWIITLPAHLLLDNGLKIFEENEFLTTNIRSHVADLDVSAS
jgi:hypothetical protein